MTDDRRRELDKQLEENEEEQREIHKILDELEEQECVIGRETGKYLRLMDESRGWRGEQADAFRRQMEAELMDIEDKAKRDIRQSRDRLKDREDWLKHEREMLWKEKQEAEEG